MPCAAFSKYQLVWPSALARGWNSSDNAHVSIRNGIARSMAPAGLKGLIVRGCEVGLTGTRATATSAGVCCGDQLFKDLAQDRVQQRLVEPRAADCGSVGGSAEDGVSSGIQRRTVEQIVDFLAPVVPERISARTEAIEVRKISRQECIGAVENASQECVFLTGARFWKCPRPSKKSRGSQNYPSGADF